MSQHVDICYERVVMHIYFLDYVYIALSILLLAGMRFVKPINGFNSDPLSKESCNIIRGFIAFIPPIGHLHDFVHLGFNNIITSYGNFMVSLFFFFTGYGLTRQHLAKDDYSKHYLVKRLPRILIPYIFATMMYVAVEFIGLGYLRSPLNVLITFTTGNPALPTSWYVVHVIVFSLWFYLMMKVCRKKRIWLVIAAIVYYVGTMYFCKSVGWGGHWWSTSFGIPVGVVWAAYEKEIYEFCKKRYWIILSVLVLVWCLYHMFGHRYQVKYVLSMILICILLMKVSLKGKILTFFGKISYEIYLVHMIMMLLFRNDRIHVANDIVYGACVLISVPIVAFVLNFADGIAGKLFDKAVAKLRGICRVREK